MLSAEPQGSTLSPSIFLLSLKDLASVFLVNPISRIITGDLKITFSFFNYRDEIAIETIANCSKQFT